MLQSASLVIEQGCDEWSIWLLRHRHGRDAAWEVETQARVSSYADKVLDACRLSPDATLVDVGAGDGAVAFRAIDRVGPGLKVVFTDISAPLLQYAHSVAQALNVDAQCTFLHAPADDLSALPEARADAVTTRAVLAYVSDKRSALREFYRLLKPGGVVSVCEPLMQDEALDTVALRQMSEERGSHPGYELLPLLHRWKAAQYPDTLPKLMTSPLSNYSERDLFKLFQECGFEHVHLELHIEARPVRGRPWEAFLQASPHPWAPTHGRLLEEQFTEAERQTLEDLIRPGVEAGGKGAVERLVYVRATKPHAPG